MLDKLKKIFTIIQSLLVAILTAGHYNVPGENTPYLVSINEYLPGILGIFLLILLTINGFVLDTLFLKRIELRRKLKNILKEVVHAVEKFQGRVGSETLRANIMFLDSKKHKLLIEAHYRMDIDPDKDISFSRGQGCAGRAFDTGETIIGDIEDAYSKNNLPWGITREHKNLTKDLKSLISIPVKFNDEIVAIINFDDKINLKESKFDHGEFDNVISGWYAFILGELIRDML